MIRYTLKQLNQQRDKFPKAEFVDVEDAKEAFITLAVLAVKAGADEDVILEFFDE